MIHDHAFECLRPCFMAYYTWVPFQWRGFPGPGCVCPNCGYEYVDWLSYWCNSRDVVLWLLGERAPLGKAVVRRRG